MFSGKFLLRVGPAMHGALQRYAAMRRISLNAACIELLESALKGGQLPDGLRFGLDGLFSPQCSLSAGIIGLVLYGSYARGEERRRSDIDILVVIESNRKITRSMYSEIDALAGLDPRVSIMIANLPSGAGAVGALWLEVAQDGKVLFDQRGRVGLELTRIRRRIAAGGFVRRKSHGQGYWIHAE